MSTTWHPSESHARAANLHQFGESVGRSDTSYLAMWRWSVDHIEEFWSAATRFLNVRWHQHPTAVLEEARMPGTQWFSDGTLNFAEHLFVDREPDRVAIRFGSESGRSGIWTWSDFERETARIRDGLIAAGVTPGDRVASCLPNLPEAVAAFAATASLGAIWTATAPEYGAQAVLSRFEQVQPRVLLGVDGYHYRGRRVEREAEHRSVADKIGARYVRLGLLDGTGWAPDVTPTSVLPLSFEPVPFNHPLWILYSSGTTGLPKPIVHGHGGALLELLKTGVLQMGFTDDDRVFWYTTTGWVMWNIMLAPLLTGAVTVLYDGGPDQEALWKLAETTRITFFGTSAAWLDAARTAGSDPTTLFDLTSIRAIGSTGSPLPAECYDWVYDTFPESTWLVSLSGGTDVVTPLLGVAPGGPVRRGELGPPSLGVDLQSWDSDGHPIVGEVGEMVVTQPMPSMPIAFWGDPGESRMHDSYFARFPGVWAHGDWLEMTQHGTAVIHGRSDATINRGGVRIGTAEIYNGLNAVSTITDALAVDLARDSTHGQLVLFVVSTSDDHPALEQQIKSALRSQCSPRHVPDHVIVVPAIPRTITGKKVEVPVKRILMGHNPDTAISRSSLENPAALDSLIAASAHLAVPTPTQETTS